jgi:hypothetical protein
MRALSPKLKNGALETNSPFKRRSLRPGAVVEIRVSGIVAEVVRYKIRSGGQFPKVAEHRPVLLPRGPVERERAAAQPVSGVVSSLPARTPPCPLAATRSGRGRRVGGAAGLAEQPPRPYPCGHGLGLRVVDTAVLELDHRIDALAAQALKVVAFASANRPLHELVVNALLVERPLHPPARVWRNLEPLVATAVKLDGHAGVLR